MAFRLADNRSQTFEDNLEKFNYEQGCDFEEKYIKRDMVLKKKENKRPELQIYRPGMGLQQKNKSKLEGNCDSSPGGPQSSPETTKSNLSASVASVESCHMKNIKSVKKDCDDSRQSSAEVVKCNGYKNKKSRRPDLQVYMPKPRLAAMVNGSGDVSSSAIKAEEANSRKQGLVEKDMPLDSSERNGNKSLPPPVEMKTHSKRFSSKRYGTRKCPNENRPNSADSSGSRSTPEGFSEENTSVHCEVINASMNETNGKTRDQCNKGVLILNNGTSTKGETYNSWADRGFSCSPEESSIPFKSESASESKPCRGIDESKSCSDLSLKTFKSTCEVQKPRTCDKGGKDLALNNQRKTMGKEENGRPKTKTIPGNSNNVRQNREKREQHLPPRLQKQVPPTLIKCESTNAKGDAGILRLPSEVVLCDDVQWQNENNRYRIHVPQLLSQYSQPQFVHKHLFNPKNPAVPEIINIPASTDFAPGSPRDYAPINPPFYMPSPRSGNNGYIPPPQPRSVGRPCKYQDVNIPIIGGMPDHSVPYIVPNLLPTTAYSSPRPFVSPSQPPSYSSDYVAPVPEEKRKVKPLVEKNLREIHFLERELSTSIPKDGTIPDLSSLRQCRWRIQLRYENIILADPSYCAERNAEQQLWKSAYYQIIEVLRKNLDSQPDNLEVKETLLTLINEGAVFYENLLEKQQETYGFTINQLLEKEELKTDSLRIVLISVQKTLIYLGDLARYKEQASGTTNFGKARSFYLKAQQLVPKNGRPYHQLGVLAMCTRRKLDAVYYFMRSLSASNPSLSAQEYLLNLFEDVRKKYEANEKKRYVDISNEIEVICGDHSECCEVWIKPDESSKICSNRAFNDSISTMEFKKLSTVELNKQFITSFLHVHGKLFTKIGMETFDDVCDQMLKEFYFLLQRKPFPLESTRLVQLSTVNMYAVGNTSSKDEANPHPLQIKALGVYQAVMCLIMQRCCSLHTIHVSSSDYARQLISDDMAQLLPTIKIWTDFMSIKRDLWPLYVAPNDKTSKYGLKLDVWSSFAQLLTSLKDLETKSLEIAFEQKEGYDYLALDEDTALSGFVPFCGQDMGYIKPPYDKENAKSLLRIARIQFFGDYLCGIPEPYLEFNVACKQFQSLVSSPSGSENDKDTSDKENLKDDSFGDESVDSEDSFLSYSLDDERSNEIKLLSSRKKALSREKARQEKYNASVQAALRNIQNQRSIVIQIQPRYLIPDTNCFIDYLAEIKEMLTLRIYNVIVPLVVINELDGLARGARENSSTPEHSIKVAAQAKAAVQFLQKEFDKRNSHLRAITSKGTIISTISYRAEDVGRSKRGTNDDLILACCMYFCTAKDEENMSKQRDEPSQLFRNIVLLTDDRNLRVKALVKNVPARDLPSFFKWAKS